MTLVTVSGAFLGGRGCGSRGRNGDCDGDDASLAEIVAPHSGGVRRGLRRGGRVDSVPLRFQSRDANSDLGRAGDPVRRFGRGLALPRSSSSSPWAPAVRIRAVEKVPVLVVLASVTAVALLYVLALIASTPPNNWDSLTYHLARAAFWSQGDRVGYIADPYDERLNFNPPNGEVALTFLLEVGRNERLTGFVQFALGACAGGRRFRTSTAARPLTEQGYVRLPRLPHAADRPPASVDDAERPRRRLVSSGGNRLSLG